MTATVQANIEFVCDKSNLFLFAKGRVQMRTTAFSCWNSVSANNWLLDVGWCCEIAEYWL